MVSRMEDFIFYDSPRNGDGCDFDATTLFEKSLVDYPFDEFLEIARNHSEGRIWIIGGFVYRNIIKELYGTPYEKRPIDIDFLVEHHKEEVDRPRDWEIGRTFTGDLSFSKKDEYKIDLNGLVNFHSIVSQNVDDPEIRHFYTGTPLNIQSISYDCEKKVVEGEAGINAIRKRHVEINNIIEAQWEVRRINRKRNDSLSVDKYGSQKAAELGFSYKSSGNF